MIIVTNGDVFLGMITVGATMAFSGSGLAVGDSLRQRIAGLMLFVVGVAVILAPMGGVVGLVMHGS
jgi:hypothetical protein